MVYCSWNRAHPIDYSVPAAKQEQIGARMMIIAMGTHMLSGQLGSQNLLQVAIPGLEDRARTFPPLHGVLLMPGKLQHHHTGTGCCFGWDNASEGR